MKPRTVLCYGFLFAILEVDRGGTKLACVAGGISRASTFFSGLMLWSWPPSSEGFGEESSQLAQNLTKYNWWLQVFMQITNKILRLRNSCINNKNM